MSLQNDFIAAPLWQKLLLFCLSAFLIFYLIYNTLFKAVFSNYWQQLQKMRALEQRLQAAHLVIKDLPLIEKKEKVTADTLTRSFSSGTDSHKTISLAARQSGLQVVSIKPITTQAYTLWEKQYLELNLIGSLAALRAFINQTYGRQTLGIIIKTIQTVHLHNDMHNISLKLDLATRPHTAKTVLKEKIQKPPYHLQGFWHQDKNIKVFINNQLLGTGDKIDSYRVAAISENTKTVILKHIRTHRKLTLKVLK